MRRQASAGLHLQKLLHAIAVRCLAAAGRSNDNLSERQGGLAPFNTTMCACKDTLDIAS
jgi:hypothetical protein